MAQHPSLSDDQIEDILTEKRFQFALKLMQSYTLSTKINKNYAFSPHVIYEGLLIIYLASSGKTESYIRQKLKLPDHILQKHIADWIRIKKRNKDKKLPDYNDESRCWITNTKCVKSTTQCLLKGELEIVGFHKDSISLKNRINKFLRKKTQGYIPNPLELNNIYTKMEMILSTILCLKGDIVTKNISTNEMHSLKEPRTVVSHKLKMIVTELPFVNKNVSFFLLFPAVEQDAETSNWQVDENISGLIERLTTKKGINDLRKILDDQEASTEKLKGEEIIYPDFFEMEYEIKIEKLIKKNQADKALLSNFTDKNLHLDDTRQWIYIKVTPKYVTAGVINIFLREKQGCLNRYQQHINYSKCIRKFIWLLYCRESHTILFIGMNSNKSYPLSLPKELKIFSEDKCSIN